MYTWYYGIIWYFRHSKLFIVEHLPDCTLSLLALLQLQRLDVDVPPHQECDQAQWQECTTSNYHLPLDVTIRLNNAVANGRADWVVCLNDQTAVDGGSQIL